MTGEPGKPEAQQEVTGESPARVAKRTAADADAALRQFEQDQIRQEQQKQDAINDNPLPTADSGGEQARRGSGGSKWFKLRQPIGIFSSVALGLLSLALIYGLWWYLTRGEFFEDRIVDVSTLPSPWETFSSFKELWFDRSLSLNTWVTMRRVAIGFTLAALVGVPVGVLAGCFAPLRSLLAPVVIFGRNIPLAALIPLTYFMFGIGESQKVMFIFIACVAFIIADATNAILEVSQKYVDTAYTLGASRRQTIIKVLFPLAMPSIFNSLRLLFGLAFGYIMLAELIRFGDEAGGLGNLINVSQRRGPREHIYLIILIIPIIALGIDRFLYWCQRQLFPHRYQSLGILNSFVILVFNFWDDVKTSLFKPVPPFDQLVTSSSNSGDKQIENDESEEQSQ